MSYAINNIIINMPSIFAFTLRIKHWRQIGRNKNHNAYLKLKTNATDVSFSTSFALLGDIPGYISFLGRDISAQRKTIGFFKNESTSVMRFADFQ